MLNYQKWVKSRQDIICDVELVCLLEITYTVIVCVSVCERKWDNMSVCVHGKEWVWYQGICSKMDINGWENKLIPFPFDVSGVYMYLKKLSEAKHLFSFSSRLIFPWSLLAINNKRRRKVFIICITIICLFFPPPLHHHTASGSGVCLGLMTADDAQTQFPAPSICSG